MSKDYLNDYDASASNNTDIGGVNVNEGCAPSALNNAIRELMSHLAGFKAQFEVGASISSSSALAVNIPGVIHSVTGTTGITSLSLPTNDTSHLKVLVFSGVLTLTNSGNLVISGGDITTKSGDVLIFGYEGSSVWRLISKISAFGAEGIDVNPGSDTDADLITVNVTGTPKLYWDESENSFRSNSDVLIDGNLSADNIGGLPQTTDSNNYTLTLADMGGHIYWTGSSSSYAVTVPPNSSVAFPIGATVTIVNDGSSSAEVQIAEGSGVTIVLAGSGATGPFELQENGMLTLVKVGTNRWFASGVGVVK